jgi:cytochrome c oxidase subunit 4
MIGAYWLNLASFVLGLLAWFFPIAGLVRRNQSRNERWTIFNAASLGACALSLCLQIFYNDHLVNIKDWSALMDTSHAVAMVSGLLLGVTILLNIIAAVVYKPK